MKKSRIILTIASAVFALSSCYVGDGLFDSITKEVPLEKGSITGIVNSFVRYTSKDDSKTELLLTSANGFFYKDKDSKTHYSNGAQVGGWNALNTSVKPLNSLSYSYYESTYNGYYVTKLAADADNVYALAMTFDYNSNGSNKISSLELFTDQLKMNGNSMVPPSEDWKKVVLTLNTTDKVNLFCTNSPVQAHRKAYVSVTTSEGTVKLYTLSGTEVTEISDWTCADSSTQKDVANAAVWDGNGIIFFTNIAVATSESSTESPVNIYYGDSNGDIWYRKAGASEFTKSSFNAGGPVQSICVTKDYLICGKGAYSGTIQSNGGIIQTKLDENGVPASTSTDFTTNASSAITNYYIVRCLLTVDPSLKSAESTIYAGCSFKGSGSSTPVSYNNIGLWSYNPDRGNWNRD